MSKREDLRRSWAIRPDLMDQFLESAMRGEGCKITFISWEEGDFPDLEELAEPPDQWRDVLRVVYRRPLRLEDPSAIQYDPNADVVREFLTTLYDLPGHKVGCLVGGVWLELGIVREEGYEYIADRNKNMGITRPTRNPPCSDEVTRSSTSYPNRTGEETRAFVAAFADARYGKNWHVDYQDQVMRHQRPRASFLVEMHPTEAERLQGMDLQRIPRRHDFNDGIIFGCILHQLAPPLHPNYTPNEDGMAWIDLDNIAKLTMPGRESAAEILRKRRKVWDLINAVQNTKLRGARSVPYKNPYTKLYETLPYDGFVWKVWGTPSGQLSLFGDVPKVVRIQVNPDFRPFLAGWQQQYMPGMEKIGGIPTGQPTGAWARAIGYSLSVDWRIHMEDAVEGKYAITRKELLERTPPNLALYESVLDSKDPGHVRKFLRGALDVLVEREILAREGEPTTCKGRVWPRQGWEAEWLNEPVILIPAKSIRDFLAEEILPMKFAPKVKDLKALPSAQRRGSSQPKKSKAE